MGGVQRQLIFGASPANALERLRSYTWFERDFLGADVADFTVVGDGSKSFAVGTTLNGWLGVSPGSTTDNDECYGITPTAFSFAANKPVFFSASCKLTEANTDDSNIVLGFSTIGTANFLVDNGAGPAANYDGALFFKVDGDMHWQTETSHTTTQQTSATAAVFASATTYELGIYWDGSASVFFYLDRSLIATHTTANALPTSNMGIVFGCKNGGTNQETLLADWVVVQGSRIASADGSIN